MSSEPVRWTPPMKTIDIHTCSDNSPGVGKNRPMALARPTGGLASAEWVRTVIFFSFALP
jgi:hypothetical protein